MKPLPLASLTAALLCGGCASVTKVQTQTAASYEHHSEKDGLTIGVHPLTQEQEVKQTFNVNLLNKGLLPVLVVAENHNPSSSFLIAKENVYVFNEELARTNSAPTKSVGAGMAGSGTAIGIVGAVGVGAGSLAATPLLFTGLAMAANATVIQHNLADKQFCSRTLNPGEKAQGFVFF